MQDTIALADAPAEAARSAGLRYVSDAKPGLTRLGSPARFRYVNAAGKRVRDTETLLRIKSLVIPPAWTKVWIAPQENGHIQAVGRDARGRKQYRYHSKWREVRDEAKYERMLAFGEAVPLIRRRVKTDLAKRGMPREKVLAALVWLLETTLIRVGNDEYAEQNKSFGLTTFRNRHAQVRGSTIQFDFLGKSKKAHKIEVTDPRLARLVRKCQDLPGQDLFCYLDEDRTPRQISSDDVNEYLRGIAGAEFTAKDFRTWAGTVLAAVALKEFEQFESSTEAKRNIRVAIESVARLLGNTPTICRKCYVHPGVLESYLAGQTIATLLRAADRRLASSLHRLKPEEAAVMMLLRERLRRAEKNGAKPTARPRKRSKIRDGKSERNS